MKGWPEYDLNFVRRFADEIGCRVVVAESPTPDPDAWSCLDTIGLQVLRPRQTGAPGDYVDDVAWGYKDMFLRCDGCNRISLMNEVYSTMKDSCGCQEKGARLMPLDDALLAARSARFEHGGRRDDESKSATQRDESGP